MSITKQALRFILEDDKASPIEGDFLSVGNASILIDSSSLKSLLQEYSKDFEDSWFINQENIDSQTRATQKVPHPCVKQEVLLRSLFPGITSFSILDCSNYEGADIVCDLNQVKAGEEKQSQFDYIFDGGVFDNIFNPANALINLNNFLREKGRLFAYNSSTFITGAMTTFSCEWFYGFFALNDFTDINTYLYCISDLDLEKSDYLCNADWFLWTPSYTPRENWNAIHGVDVFRKKYISSHVLVSARKKEKTKKEIKIPQNLHYCFSEDDKWAKFETKPTITFSNTFKDPKKIKEFSKDPLYFTDHFTYICTY